VNSMTARDNGANDMYDAFDFTQQPRPPMVLTASGSPYPLAPQTLMHSPSTLVTVNSAYATYSLAPVALASIYGAGLASATAVAKSLPLSTMLGGTSVTVTDSMGTMRSAPVYYVSSDQVNYIVPDGSAGGSATVTVTSGGATVATGTTRISPSAPGLFTANQTGQGAPAAQVLYVHADNSQTLTPASHCDTTGRNCTPVPIAFANGDQLYLILYGTGIRGRSVLTKVSVNAGNVNIPALYAGPQAVDPGLDQVNALLPVSLKGRGQLAVTVTVDGQASNMVQLTFQ